MEVGIEKRVNKFWAVCERYLDDDFLSELEAKFDGWQYRSGLDEGSIVDACEFLSHLRFGERLSEYLNSLYKKEPDYPAEAMLKAVFLMDLKGMVHYSDVIQYLSSHKDKALLLGFKRDARSGEVLSPKYKNFWYFINKRLVKKGWDTVFRLLREECVIEGRNHDISIGHRVMEDATPIESHRNDKEASYSGHYKVKGYKLDTITDSDYDIPLAKMVLDINADESKCFILQHATLLEDGITVHDTWIDCGYCDYPNLAWAGINGITAHHKISSNWVYNPKGTVEAIKREYQKYWKEEDFKADADLDYMLRYLYAHGKYEHVGAYFRNIAMERYAKNPYAYLKDYHLRNRQEGRHGYWKEQLRLEQRLRVKGIKKVDIYLTHNLCTILAVALCRIQHGIKQKLTSVAYIT